MNAALVNMYQYDFLYPYSPRSLAGLFPLVSYVPTTPTRMYAVLSDEQKVPDASA
ncbi:hypothetical protein PC116_g5884 [Phytophthora cactorum]|uniref:Uncharacterized protein n=1 Tax=Phytophthora cactorum TaxID=29920 RepID=A0A8T1DH75_9STRA|nr:hypothetical protein Pcac1_g3894 [Phytophthora cactorum]KAG2938402.1 hypothetical protein PC115_g3751 [Phytophthora cactorum]KAG2950689.1 hypothetical protein PC117_g4226 [Phytophthora cactorum]KAG3031970.1 hypothetical protein PC120_g2773 [Phytophthora cactorum]KAG3200145.1 hypothetical protein PC128_g4776 [Phytophthora cactorum]